MTARLVTAMREHADARDRTATRSPGRDVRPARRDVVGSEDLLVRNYDHRWGYDLAIEAVDPSGEVVFERSYYLQPGQVKSEMGVLDEGEYEIRAVLDNLQEATLSCRVDPEAEHTAVVEVGNGALSLTEGLYR